MYLPIVEEGRVFVLVEEEVNLLKAFLDPVHEKDGDHLGVADDGHGDG